MSDVILPVTRPKSVLELMRAIMSTLRSYWDQAENYQKFLYFVGALLLTSGVFHAGVQLVTGGSLAGPVSWRKPIAFGFSTGLTCVSVAWVMTFLRKHRLPGWLFSSALAISFLVEVVLIDMQQWRGVPSHFNLSTPFDSAVFSVMGTFIALVEVVVILVTLWTFFSLQAPPSLKWAIRLGMVFLVISQIFGNLIVQNGLPKVTDAQTGAFISDAVKSAYIFGPAGSIKVPHALTMHAVQVLPVLALLLLFTNWSERRRLTVVMGAAAGYAGLVLVSAFQTFSGRAMFDMSLLPALGFGISIVIPLAACAAAVIGLRQTLAQAPSETDATQTGG